MKKIIYLTCILAIGMIGIGCSNKTKDLGDLGETRKIENLSVTPQKVTSDPGSGNNNLVAISFLIKNRGNDVLGIGAGDFHIKDSKGKEISIDGKNDNFGQEIKGKKTIEGKAYFLLPDTESKFTLIYKPNQIVEAEWEHLRIP